MKGWLLRQLTHGLKVRREVTVEQVGRHQTQKLARIRQEVTSESEFSIRRWYLTMKETPFSVMNEQADDESLWFVPETVGEYLLQSALRRLHEIIEGKTSKECAMEMIEKWAIDSLTESPKR